LRNLEKFKNAEKGAPRKEEARVIAGKKKNCRGKVPWEKKKGK